MVPKNLVSVQSESKLKRKTLKSTSHNNFSLNSNLKINRRAESNRFPSIVTEDLRLHEDPKKSLLKYANSNHLSYNAFDHHILSYSG